MKLDTEEKRTFARSRLERAISDGASRAGSVVQQILSVTPVDEITPAGEGRLVVGDYGVPHYVTRSGSSPMSDHAFAQLSDRIGAPYLRTLVSDSREEDQGWRATLAEHVAREHSTHSEDRFLVRRVDGQVRGVLSDRFKRLDSRPLLDSFIGAVSAMGAIPVGGHATETRVAIRCILPQIHEPTEGECVVYGLNWQNSDFGAASYSVAFFTMRLVCLNGMVAHSVLKKTHLGSRLDEAMLYSNRTIELDTEALRSATVDTVRAYLAPERLTERTDRIRALASQELDLNAQLKSLSKILNKGELDALKTAYEGPDELNMPSGNTAWRFANALSWVANAPKIAEDRKLELQSLAGKLAA